MIDNELISIIVPIYNASSMLEKCVSTIINQTYKNIEILLIDDGSTDDSLVIAKELESKDNRIKVFSQLNLGVSAARNLGIEKSKGEYVGFVDSDDWIDKDMYLEMYKSIKKNNSDLTLCNFIRVYGEKEVKKDEFYNINSNDKNLKEVVLRKIISRGEENIFGSCCKMLISKKILLDNNLKFEIEMKMSEDMMFLIKCIDASSKININDKFLYYYRTNPNSATSNFIAGLWEDNIKLIDWCKDNIKYSKYKFDLDYLLKSCITNAVILATANSCKPGTTMNFIDRVRYSNNLSNNTVTKVALKSTWKDKTLFTRKYWLQAILIALKLNIVVVFYHSLKNKTI